MFKNRSDSPQVKRNLISTSIKKLLYDLPHELPIDLKLKIIGIQEF